MLTETKNISELLPAEYNPRKALKPGDKEYEKLKRSIQQFNPVTEPSDEQRADLAKTGTDIVRRGCWPCITVHGT